MGNELVPMQEIMDLGTVLAKSGYFTDSRDAAQAVVKVLAGRELGFGPIASMTGVYIVKGKVALSANLMAAAIKRSGRYNYRVLELTDKACRIEFYENGQAIGTSEFTMENAAKAGLAGESNWGKYPRNMLFARALSNGAKWYCPDLSGGPLYTPDELGAVIDGESGEVIEATATVVEHQSQGTNTNGKPALRPGEQVWADWTGADDAKAWAVTQRKFNHDKHLENAYQKVRANVTAAGSRKADDMWQAWWQYVTDHEPQEARWPELDTDAELDDLFGAGKAGTVEQ